MDELAKSIQEKYIEDLTSKYPLHRFLTLFMVIFFMLNYEVGSDNIYAILSETSIKDVLDFQGGLLAKLTIIQLLLALVIVYFLNVSYKKINKLSFIKLTNLHDFSDYTAKVIKKYEKIRRNDAYDFFIVKEIDKKIEIKKIELRAKAITSELCMSLLICILWSFNFSTTNLLALLSLATAFVIFQWRMYKFYIIQFFPLYVARNHLLNEDISFEDGYNE